MRARAIVRFPGGGGHEIAGRLDLPVGPPLAYALFAHCFRCGKDLRSARRIASELTNAGIAVLSIDFTGLGASGGEFAATTFTTNLDDLRQAAGWLAEHRHAPQLLIGHSLGGAAVLAVAADIASVRAVASIGAPADTTHVLRHLRVEDGWSNGRAHANIGGRPFLIGRELVDDLGRHAVEDRLAALRAALLVLHSPVDNVVGIEHASRLYLAARHPKSFVSLDGADHLLSEARDGEFAAQMIGAWARRYLAHEHPPAPAPAPSAPVVVAETGQGTFLNHVVVGPHRFQADEPESAGGLDAGPSPYDLLGAALGACTSMTLRMYAGRKALPLEQVRVEVHHAKVHADDCSGCVDGPKAPLIDRFTRRIHLEGALDEAQRKSLLAIANKCPVHRTLEASSHIVTELAG